jgi:hydroxymethylpyrimidine/phosphomethylpyrimidine kinase
MGAFKMKTVLCIGGSDPSSGAGIQVDIPVVLAHGHFPLTAVTAITAQNSMGVYDVYIPEPQVLRLQLEVLNKDYNIDAVKIGMLGTSENVEVVSAFLKDKDIKNIVIDPIFKSSSGYNLLNPDGMIVLQEQLFALATVVSPNIDEAEYLTQTEIRNIDGMKEAAKLLMDSNIKSVIIKGGHMPEEILTDVVFDGKKFELISSKRIPGELRGTGCLYSSSLVSNLANGLNLEESAQAAKKYVEKMIKNGYQLGGGTSQVINFNF